MQLRPSLKFIKLSYAMCVLLAGAIAVFWKTVPNSEYLVWAFVVPGFLLLLTVARHTRRRTVKLTIQGERVRYESGLLSKTTRTMELAKIQDVRVDQTFGQRLVNIGDVSFETAGGSSRIVMQSLDRPQEAADHILALARTVGGRVDPPSAAI